MKHWFLPDTPDVLSTLCEQAAVTLAGLQAFAAWSAGTDEQAQKVRDAEHEADKVRRRLQTQLLSAFSLPLDAEDLYELSERLDAVLNGAKNAVREAEVMGMGPDSHLQEMAGQIAAGGSHLAAAFATLTKRADEPIKEADAAIASGRDVEHAYRTAMAEAAAIQDVRELFGRRELYRRYARIGDGVVAVAERVWYSVVKQR